MQNQRGFIGIGLLITIMLGLFVVGGGAYYVMHQQTPSPTSSDNTLDNSQTLPTNTQSNTQATNTTPSVSSSFAANPASGTAGHAVTFSSSLGGKTGTGYFIDWGDNAEVWYTCGQNIPILHISGGEAENCLPVTVQHTYVGANSYTATLNKITGISADGHYTSAVVGTATVAITGTNTLPSPTCTITASPSTATVGQKIIISWTTQNANAEGPAGYGAWVGLGGGDSILTQMIAPTSLSGSQTIIAQKVGNEKLGLDINGPGGNGRGSCSVQITTGAGGTSNLQTYINSRYGFNVQYPSDMPPSAPDAMTYGGIPYGTVVVQFGMGAVVISISNKSTDVSSCMLTPPSDVGKDVKTVNLGDVSFLTYTSGDAGTGHSYTYHEYRTVREGVCFSLSSTQAHVSGSPYTADDAAYAQKLDSVIQSFRFTQ